MTKLYIYQLFTFKEHSLRILCPILLHFQIFQNWCCIDINYYKCLNHDLQFSCCFFIIEH